MIELVALVVLSAISGASFLAYGRQTLVSEGPRIDFDRYGLPGARVAVGCAQLLGAVGVIVGLRFALVGAAAATGLATMMVSGLIVRIYVHDAPRLMVPAALLALINIALVALFLVR